MLKLSPAEFLKPFTYQVFDGCLPVWAELLSQYPKKELFRYRGGERAYGRPHLTNILKISEINKGPGFIALSDIPEQISPLWGEFVSYIMGPKYRDHMASFIGHDDWFYEIAWHRSDPNTDTPPHVDSQSKLATHLFYFHTPEDWKLEWGGDFCVLDSLQKETPDPEFEDFAVCQKWPIIGDRSILALREPSAWHGVQTLQSPPGVQRLRLQVCAHKRRDPI